MPKVFIHIFFVLKILWFFLALCILLKFRVIIPIFPVLGVFTIFIFITFFLFLWKKGYSPAYLYILGWLSLITGIIIFSLLRFNYISSNTITESSIGTGILLMVLCFHFSFSSQMKLIKNKKQMYQLKLIEKANENEFLIRKQKKMLEQQVEQRTKELKIAKEKAEQAHLMQVKHF